MGSDLGLSLRELIISFGFLEGIWIAVGVDPKDEVITFFADVIGSSDPWLNFIFKILPSVLLLLTAYIVYRMGGMVGITATFLAFIAGLAVIYSPLLTGLLIIMAMVVGKFARGPNSGI